ncbi:MAG TPA: hypothetical protein VN325_44135 [Steroidobacteraceae bacterium]|nr:hypothetical protein [Steroidobacteraceae bacterium]
MEFHRFISNRFKRTLVVSGGVLIGSVVAIPFADMLSGCVVWAWIVMIAGVLAFAVCIILYGFLIRAVLGMATFESKQVASLISW